MSWSRNFDTSSRAFTDDDDHYGRPDKLLTGKKRSYQFIGNISITPAISPAAAVSAPRCVSRPESDIDDMIAQALGEAVEHPHYIRMILLLGSFR